MVVRALAARLAAWNLLNDETTGNAVYKLLAGYPPGYTRATIVSRPSSTMMSTW